MITTTYESLCSFDTLYKTYKKCCIGRRYSLSKERFEQDIANNLMKLQESLIHKTYQMEPYRYFKIREPKERIIRILSFKDKIVQRLLCDEIFNDYLYRHSIYDSAACQKGKGVSFAIRRLEHHLHSYYKKHGNKGYFLKFDIANYYPSIDIDIVKKQWLRQIEDNDVKALINYILNTHKKGLPMGNQLSQIFAVYYLNPIDRLIKEAYRIKYYTRYLDDGVMLHSCKEQLQAIRYHIEECLEDMNLTFNERKTQIIPIKNGVDYMGWHFYLTDTGKVIKKIRRSNKQNTKKKIKRMNYEVKQGMLTMYKYNQKVRGIMANLKKGNTYGYRRKMMKKFTYRVVSKTR